jgi:hypothetical protein
MKNFTFTLALVFVSVLAFGQITFYSPFIQKNDTLILTGIDSNEVKIDLAEYASNVAVKTDFRVLNEKAFTNEQNMFLNKIAIAEAIEDKAQIVSKLDKFREKNVQLGGKTPIIERQITVYVKSNTTIIYN